jgi:hypothetical protein
MGAFLSGSAELRPIRQYTKARGTFFYSFHTYRSQQLTVLYACADSRPQGEQDLRSSLFQMALVSLAREQAGISQQPLQTISVLSRGAYQAKGPHCVGR